MGLFAAGTACIITTCAVSVVKGRSCSRRSRYKPCIKRDKCFCGYSCGYPCGYQWLFLVNYFSTFGKMTLPRLRSIPAGFCKLNRRQSQSVESSVFLVSIIFCIRTRKCTKLFTENITEYFAHVHAVCTRPLLWGKGPGDEARGLGGSQYDYVIQQH